MTDDDLEKGLKCHFLGRLCKNVKSLKIRLFRTAFLFLSSFGSAEKRISIAVTTAVILVFGEALPKVPAVNYPIRFSSFVSLPLIFFSFIVHPAVWVLEKIPDLFSFLLGRSIIAAPASSVVEVEMCQD